MSAAIDMLLSRLDGVRPSRKNGWMARCPAHNGDGRSMAVTHCDDGRILIHCFAHQCDVSDILSAIGMAVTDLFPDRLPDHRYEPRKHGVSPIDVVRVLRHELLVLEIAAKAMAEGTIRPDLCERSSMVAQRVRTALDLCDA